MPMMTATCISLSGVELLEGFKCLKQAPVKRIIARLKGYAYVK